MKKGGIFKDSGLGRELGPEGLDPYLEYQSVYASTRYLESTTSAGAARNATASSPAEVVAAYFAGVAAGDAAAVADLFARMPCCITQRAPSPARKLSDACTKVA